jgi:riboflavin synthase
MFTGIVQATGRIHSLERRGGDLRLAVAPAALGLDDVGVGDSICVSGVCLTVVAIDASVLAFDVSTETLDRTSLGAHAAGDAVNLEKSLRLSDRLGGHLVSGHVDGVGEVVSITDDARTQRWTFRAPAALMRYIAPKGSIAVDGVSLTVNEVGPDAFGVTLIPHTVSVTTFRERRVGDAVNLEVDPVARYVERLMQSDRSASA